MGPPYVTQSGQELGIILPQLPGTRKHTWLVLSPFLREPRFITSHPREGLWDKSTGLVPLCAFRLPKT